MKFYEKHSQTHHKSEPSSWWAEQSQLPCSWTLEHAKILAFASSTPTTFFPLSALKSNHSKNYLNGWQSQKFFLFFAFLFLNQTKIFKHKSPPNDRVADWKRFSWIFFQFDENLDWVNEALLTREKYFVVKTHLKHNTFRICVWVSFSFDSLHFFFALQHFRFVYQASVNVFFTSNQPHVWQPLRTFTRFCRLNCITLRFFFWRGSSHEVGSRQQQHR